MHGDRLLTPAELDFIDRFHKAYYFRDTSVYKDENGEDIPEIWDGIYAMLRYQKEAEAEAQARNSRR